MLRRYIVFGSVYKSQHQETTIQNRFMDFVHPAQVGIITYQTQYSM